MDKQTLFYCENIIAWVWLAVFINNLRIMKMNYYYNNVSKLNSCFIYVGKEYVLWFS